MYLQIIKIDLPILEKSVGHSTLVSKAQPNPHVVETGGQLRCEIGGLRKAPTQHGIEVLGALIASGSERFIHLGPLGYPIYVDAYC